MVFDYLCHICNTICGMYFYKFSDAWDKRLSAILDDEANWVDVGGSSCVLNISTEEHTLSVWVANRWYSYGYLCELDGKHIENPEVVRPRFRTMRRLHRVAERYQNERRSDAARRLGAFYRGEQ